MILSKKIVATTKKDNVCIIRKIYSRLFVIVYAKITGVNFVLLLLLFFSVMNIMSTLNVL